MVMMEFRPKPGRALVYNRPEVLFGSILIFTGLEEYGRHARRPDSQLYVSDLMTVWEVVQVRLPELKPLVEKLLR